MKYLARHSRTLIVLSLTGIFLLSLFLRTFQLNSVVPILNRDEAALGYNAYLLAETGKDEWGVRWPISPRSFGDSKLIGYPTLLVGLFTFLPQEDWVVRLPAVLAGSLLPIAFFFLSRKLKISKKFALAGSLLLSVTPVFIHFSRFGYEAVVALLYITVALVILLGALQQTKIRVGRLLLLSVLLFLSLITYNSPLILIPLLALLPWIFIGQKKPLQLLSISLATIIPWIGALVLLWPMLSQKSGISIFTDQTFIQAYPLYREHFSGIWQTVLGNRYLFLAEAMIARTLQSFSPTFLVLSGGTHPWHALVGHAHLSWLSYTTALLGIVAIVTEVVQKSRSTKQHFSRNWLLILILLLVSLIPASITVDAPHATRSLLFFVLLLLFSTWFLEFLYLQITRVTKNLILANFYLGFSILAILISGMCYFQAYFNMYPHQAVVAYQAGLPQVLNDLDDTYPDQAVAVLDPGGYTYILVAWYEKMSPAYFFATVKKQLPNSIGLQYGEQVGRFHFVAQFGDQNESEKLGLYWDEKLEQWQVIQL
ncbi:glycosyltransferase family 39 protein [Candidatus Woesebacteria bacterium]|nr:glycosyltransferase family 39 protein [Candidatus Woesebacteria bacterium]